jgi:pyranose oxidase
METIRTDVLIVGSGPVGCTFARRLVEAGRRVLMVDAGAQLSKRPGEHLKNAFGYQRNLDRFTPIVEGLLNPLSVAPGGLASAVDPIAFRAGDTIRNAQNPRQPVRGNLPGAAVGYAVGGMFTHWTSNTPRHHPTLERIPFISTEEWSRLYGHAEMLLNTRLDVYRDSIRHTVVKEALNAFYGDRLAEPVQELPVAGERRSDNDEFVHFTGSDTVLGPLIDEGGPLATGHFELRAQHRVYKLVAKGGRIVAAELHDLMGGQPIRVEAELFVVAAGFLTTQLLSASGIGGPALGRYLTEHPIAFTQIVLSRELVERIPADPRFSERAAQVEDADPVPIPMHDPPPMAWIPVSEGRPWHCQVHRDSFHYGALPPDVDDRLVVDLRWFGMTDIDPDNRVEFEADIRDTYGMPKPTFHFALSEDDRRRAHAMMGDMLQAAGALGGFLPGSEPRFLVPGSSLHFQGHFRTGEQPQDSVTDPYGRVWDYENLLLGGNGIIPTRTASNPSLTSVALALRAVHHALGEPVPPLPVSPA